MSAVVVRSRALPPAPSGHTRLRSALLWSACILLGTVLLIGCGLLELIADLIVAVAPDTLVGPAASTARLLRDVGAQTSGIGPFGGVGAGAAAAGAAGAGRSPSGGDAGDGDPAGDAPTDATGDEDIEC